MFVCSKCSGLIEILKNVAANKVPNLTRFLVNVLLRYLLRNFRARFVVAHPLGYTLRREHMLSVSSANIFCPKI